MKAIVEGGTESGGSLGPEPGRHPMLEGLEADPATLDQGDQLAVEDQPARVLGRGQACQLRHARSVVLLAAAEKPQPAAIEEGDGTVTHCRKWWRPTAAPT